MLPKTLISSSAVVGLLFCASAVVAQDPPAPAPAADVAPIEPAPPPEPAASAVSWGEVGTLGATMTLIDLRSIAGPESARTAISMAVSTVERPGGVAGEQTRWEFNCRARNYRGTGYRTIEADFTTGDFDASNETPEIIIAGSMVEAISQTACGTSEPRTILDSLEAAVAHAREP